MKCANLNEYMETYGALLGAQAEKSLRPLHVPGRDELPKLELLRQPFEAQWHVIAAGVKQLQRDKTVGFIAEMGTGKTLLAIATFHALAAGKPYRALVMCPGQLVDKWAREVRETLPAVRVIAIKNWKDLLTLKKHGKREKGAEWYVVSRDRAKLGSGWKASFVKRTHVGDSFIKCPTCGGRLVTKEGIAIGPELLEGRKRTCEWVFARNDGGTIVKDKGCGGPLWQAIGKPWRFAPADYIKRKLRGYFDYFVADEVHELKGAGTAQGNAFAALSACTEKTIILTGTLIGGYANHLRPILFRVAPRTLVKDGLGWSDAVRFDELYGRIETRETTRSGGDDYGDDNRQSRGSKRTKTKHTIPGVMPMLFGKHLLDKAIFLSLDEVAENLPVLDEDAVPVPMDQELSDSYRKVESRLRNAISEMMAVSHGQDKRLLGKMVNTLLAYPDHPYDWGPVGYMDKSVFVTVCIPNNLDPAVIRPKERKLIDMVLEENKLGRQCWVFVQFTNTYPVQDRLAGLLEAAGLKAKVLNASVPPEKREAWIAKNAPGCDVVLSHPKLVETGLDLFDKGGGHNFPTLLFYETGYSLFTCRQASRRAWRIGQKELCKVRYLYYEGTMQERAVALMGEKMTASLALEGKFSAEGLMAMANDDSGSMEMAMARSLAGKIKVGDARRHWQKISGGGLTAPVPKVEPVVVKAASKKVEQPTLFDSMPPFEPVTGPDFCKLMRKSKVTIKVLAEAVAVTQKAIKEARKAGVTEPAWLQYLASVAPKVAEKVVKKRKARATSGGKVKRARVA